MDKSLTWFLFWASFFFPPFFLLFVYLGFKKFKIIPYTNILCVFSALSQPSQWHARCQCWLARVKVLSKQWRTISIITDWPSTLFAHPSLNWRTNSSPSPTSASSFKCLHLGIISYACWHLLIYPEDLVILPGDMAKNQMCFFSVLSSEYKHLYLLTCGILPTPN